MRLAIIQEQVDVRRGGAETSTCEMARHLVRLGLDVTIVRRGAPGAPPAADEFSVRTLPTRGLTKFGQTYRFLRDVIELCRAERFDVVHAVTPCLCADVYQPRGGTYAETIARSLALAPPELRAVKSFGRLFNMRQRFLYRVERQLLERRRGRVYVAAISHYVQQQVVRGMGFPAERTRVVFNGVDIAALEGEPQRDVRAELGGEPGTPIVLFVAHNFKLKGLRELLHASARPAATWVVAVVGRDDARPYARLARRLRISARVHFVGAAAEMASWYRAADVLAHPTWYDPCSRVVLEALALGLPVVTTRYNGAAEVMERGRHGVVIDEPSDADGLAAAIGEALRAETRAACGADAARLRARVSMARHAQELKELYDEFMAGRGAARER